MMGQKKACRILYRPGTKYLIKGNLINYFNFLFYFLMPRMLGPDIFGLFFLDLFHRP